MGAGESRTMDSSPGVDVGVGEQARIILQEGVLCGRGETSMCSSIGAGEDGGSGGVVTKSSMHVRSGCP